MSLFKAPTTGVGYFKSGFFGQNGTGKSVTSALLCIGIIRKLGGGKVAWFDTEGGFGYVKHLFEMAGVQVEVAQTQSFKDLAGGIREASDPASGFKVLNVDSITHPWRTLVQGWKKSKGYGGKGLPIYAWDILKTEWREGWALPYVNSPLHIIMCGRSSNVFEDIYDEKADERKSVVVGTKMATEGETGYEPSLLVELSKEMRPTNDAGRAIEKESAGEYVRRAFVVKDRFMEIDGLSTEFVTPRDKTGKPDLKRLIEENHPMRFFGRHIDHLSLGKGTSVVVGAGSDTSEMFDDPASASIAKRRTDVEIVLEQIPDICTKHFPGSSALDKKAKGDLLEAAFGTRTWAAIQRMKLEDLQAGYAKIYWLLETLDRGVLVAALGAGVEDGKVVNANQAIAELREALTHKDEVKPVEGDEDLDAILPLGKPAEPNPAQAPEPPAPVVAQGSIPLDPEPKTKRKAEVVS